MRHKESENRDVAGRTNGLRGEQSKGSEPIKTLLPWKTSEASDSERRAASSTPSNTFKQNG